MRGFTGIPRARASLRLSAAHPCAAINRAIFYCRVNKSQVLNPACEASRICLDGIEDVLAKHDLEIGRDWWTHFKEGYYKFVDENINENSRHESWICHQSPPGKGLKR